MIQFDINISATAEIVGHDFFQNQKDEHQNFCRVKVKNGPTHTTVLIPLKREASVTKYWKSKLQPGDFLKFEGTLDSGELVCTKADVIERKVKKQLSLILTDTQRLIEEVRSA